MLKDRVLVHIIGFVSPGEERVLSPKAAGSRSMPGSMSPLGVCMASLDGQALQEVYDALLAICCLAQKM